MLEDTIIAVATPPGFGGLGVVRVSGPEALRVAGRIFAPKERRGRSFPVRRPVFGAVRDPDGGPGLDEGFLTYFRAPRSYTREDVVEISVHGSPAVLEAVLLLGTRAGARLAGPGEFTLRAYLNGRLDMIQAQAVDDLVRSVSLTQARVSSRQLGGSLSRRMAKLRARLVSLLARIEAGLEFPEEGLRTSAAADRKALGALAAEAGRLAAGFEAGRAIGEGVTLAIAGRTNVGKSTLFNALLEEDRAIVTPYPGTTRDYLRERVVLDGVVVHLVDMAGLGRAAHPVERTGIARGRKIAREADGVLLVLDASRRAGPDDRELVRKHARKKVLVVLNKTDLARKIDAAAACRLAGPAPVVEVSALKGTNIDGLRAAIRSSFLPGTERAEEVVLHARQRDCLEGIRKRLESAGRLIDGGHSGEVYAEEVRAALRLVGEMTGEVRADEVLEDIFGRFCVGK